MNTTTRFKIGGASVPSRLEISAFSASDAHSALGRGTKGEVPEFVQIREFVLIPRIGAW